MLLHTKDPGGSARCEAACSRPARTPTDHNGTSVICGPFRSDCSHLKTHHPAPQSRGCSYRKCAWSPFLCGSGWRRACCYYYGAAAGGRAARFPQKVSFQPGWSMPSQASPPLSLRRSDRLASRRTARYIQTDRQSVIWCSARRNGAGDHQLVRSWWPTSPRLNQWSGLYVLPTGCGCSPAQNYKRLDLLSSPRVLVTVRPLDICTAYRRFTR